MLSLLDSGKIVGPGPVSIKQIARRCNLQFPLSLRQFLNTRACPFPSCVVLHIKVLETPRPETIETMLRTMRQIYSTAGIRVVVGSRENLVGPAFTALLDVDCGNCDPDEALPAEQDQLFQNVNGVGENEIVIYFVRDTVPSHFGCATHPANQPGAIVARRADRWTLAHEVGHVLGLNHITGEDTNCPPANPHCCDTPDTTRLMTGCGTGGDTGSTIVTQDEINTMANSNLTNPC